MKRILIVQIKGNFHKNWCKFLFINLFYFHQGVGLNIPLLWLVNCLEMCFYVSAVAHGLLVLLQMVNIMSAYKSWMNTRAWLAVCCFTRNICFTQNIEYLAYCRWRPFSLCLVPMIFEQGVSLTCQTSCEARPFMVTQRTASLVVPHDR